MVGPYGMVEYSGWDGMDGNPLDRFSIRRRHPLSHTGFAAPNVWQLTIAFRELRETNIV